MPSWWIEAARLQPLVEDCRPAFVIGAGRQLGNIVRRRIGFETADLPEIVDRMGGIARTAADAENKDAPASERRRQQQIGTSARSRPCPAPA